MSFEDTIGQVNAGYFFREFTFSTNTFKPGPNAQLELADEVVWLDNLLIVSQIKERQAPADTTAENERKWFADEVTKKATRQIRDTLRYLKTYPHIEVSNNRGRAFNIATANVTHLHKLVIYSPHRLLPAECALKKHHRSKTAGVIHLMHAPAYLGVLGTLVTAAEIGEYLVFRETVVSHWERAALHVSEKALVGQYLRNLPDEEPDVKFAAYVDALDQGQGDWDISPIINLFLERKTTTNPVALDYKIIAELAKLVRTDMSEFRKRWEFSMTKALSSEFCPPHRFTASTGCGFVFVPLRREDISNRRNALLNFTALNKYDQKLDKCIGLSFITEGDGNWCDVQWYLSDFPWKEDSKIQVLLSENYPFRPVKEKRIERYGLT
jgi:hypothetical protein